MLALSMLQQQEWLRRSRRWYVENHGSGLNQSDEAGNCAFSSAALRPAMLALETPQMPRERKDSQSDKPAQKRQPFAVLEGQS
jgi:hypothetical protein